jgi:hypothetical protein
MDRPGPALGLALFICVEVFRDGHGADHRAADTPADLAPVFPPNSWRK